MDDLVQFLKDRLAEDEDTAKDPTSAPWATAEWRFNDAGESPYVDLGTIHLDSVSSLNESEMRHIARHDPASVLADVQAKREVVRLAERAHDYHETFMSGFAAEMEKALRLFAVAYAAHPDYQETWKR